MPSCLFFSQLLYLVAVLYLIDEDFCRLKTWYKMLINYNGGIAGNIASNFLLSFLIDEASKATNIDIMSARHGIFYNGKEGFDRCGNVRFIDAGFLCNLIYNVCFRHGAGCYCLFLGSAKLNFAARIKNNIRKF